MNATTFQLQAFFQQEWWQIRRRADRSALIPGGPRIAKGARNSGWLKTEKGQNHPKSVSSDLEISETFWPTAIEPPNFFRLVVSTCPKNSNMKCGSSSLWYTERNWWWKPEIVARQQTQSAKLQSLGKLMETDNHPWNGGQSLPHRSAEPRRTPVWRFLSPAAPTVWQNWTARARKMRQLGESD